MYIIQRVLSFLFLFSFPPQDTYFLYYPRLSRSVLRILFNTANFLLATLIIICVAIVLTVT